MKKKLIMVICCSVLVLSACGSKKTTDSTNNAVTTKASQSVVEEETGHPSGEIQKMYLYVNGTLYEQKSSMLVYKDKTEADVAGYENYKYYGDVNEEDNLKLPEKDLCSSRIEVGSKVYVNEKDTKDILVYSNQTIFFLGKATE